MYLYRGTVDYADIMTDLVGRPQHHEFLPNLKGSVHTGIFKSAQNVVDSILGKLQDAVLQEPGLPILVAGIRPF